MEDGNKEFSRENEGDIDKMKYLYMKFMSDYYIKSPMTGPWTRAWIKYTKKILWDYDRKMLSNNELKSFKKIIKGQYFVDAKRLGARLRRVVDSDQRKGIPVVAAEDAFNIIWEMHLKSNHGSVTDTMKLISDEYYMDVQCVDCVIKLCHICKEKIESNTVVPPGFNRRATLQILDMSTTPDDIYKYVMIYTDEFTGLVQLRAIKEGEESEITFNLMNIFADLGLPKILIVHDSKKYNNIINNLNDIFYPCLINIYLKLLDNSKINYIKNMLKEWTETENTIHWQIGCYDVQWRINNLNTTGGVPQHVVFRNNTICENSMVQRDSAGDAKSATSNESDIQPSSIMDQDIMLFEEPVTANPNPEPANSNSQVGGILQAALVRPQQTLLKNNNVEPGVFEVKQIKSSKYNILRKAYVNKKALASKQNIISYNKSDESTLQLAPPVASTVIPVVFGSQNHTIDISKTLPITVEHPKVPLKLEIMSFPTCSICNTEILNKSYTCMECASDIHMDCGKFVRNSLLATENQIVCMSCHADHTEAKKIKIK